MKLALLILVIVFVIPIVMALMVCVFEVVLEWLSKLL